MESTITNSGSLFNKFGNYLSYFVDNMEVSQTSEIQKYIDSLEKILIEEELESSLITALLRKYETELEKQKGKLNQQIIREILKNILLNYVPKESSVNLNKFIIFYGNKGGGKTTQLCKLANYLIEEKSIQSSKILIINFDNQRVGAIDQLKQNAKLINVTVMNQEENILTNLNLLNQYDYVLCDTKGMEENNFDSQYLNIFNSIEKHMRTNILVINNLVGKIIYLFVENFKQFINFDGIILTNCDSKNNVRVGILLSAYYTLGIPVMFLSSGEHVTFHKIKSFEEFKGINIIDRLLGNANEEYMSKVFLNTLDSMAEEDLTIDILSGNITYLTCFNFIKNYSSGMFFELIEMLAPQIGNSGTKINMQSMKNSEISNEQINMSRALINSMTEDERLNKIIITDLRKEKIFKGCGVNPIEGEQILLFFDKIREQTLKMNENIIKQFGGQVDKQKIIEIMRMYKNIPRKQREETFSHMLSSQKDNFLDMIKKGMNSFPGMDNLKDLFK